MSDYRMQIIHTRTRDVVIGWQPGDRVEIDLVEDLIHRAKAKGVGFFKSEATVVAGLRQAFKEMLLDLKGRV